MIKKVKLRIEFNNIGVPELESLLQYNTILGSGFLVKDVTLNTNTYYRVLEAEMCCQSVIMKYTRENVFTDSGKTYIVMMITIASKIMLI